MTIAIDARVLMNENYSGVSWYAFNLLAALFELDRENEYVLFYNSKKPVKLPKFDYPNVSYKGFRFSNKLFNFCLNFFSWPKLDELVGGCDIFFAPNLHFVSWSDKCRKVIVVHDLSFLAYPNFFNLKQRLWHKLILNKKILTQADMVIADSNSTKKDLEDLMNVAPEKIEVAHLGADIKANGITREEINSKYNLPDKYFLFVGTIEPRKNLAGVINALNLLLDGVSLAVAGQWGWKNEAERKMMEGNKRAVMLGYVSEEEKSALYKYAVALVYPSFYEGFGLPILEAMKSGCPVIAGNNSSQGEVSGEAGLLVDPFNINEIKAAMEIMLNNSDLRSEFIKRGYEQAGKFTWRKTAEQVKAIFEKLGNEKALPK
jgi:glycosyltransferase involved in cell wall biosynthesis